MDRMEGSGMETRCLMKCCPVRRMDQQSGIRAYWLEGPITCLIQRVIRMGIVYCWQSSAQAFWLEGLITCLIQRAVGRMAV